MQRRGPARVGSGALLAVLVLAGAACGKDPSMAPVTVPKPAVIRTVNPNDWPGYGYDAQHTFHGRSTLTPARAKALKPAWTFTTGDAVTATPTVVGGSVYVGSWDGSFYALDLLDGSLRWKFRLHRQDAIKPIPGAKDRGSDSDGGLVTSSAWFEPGQGARPDLVIFGGGYTLYALNAKTGALVWSHEYTGRPEQPADPNHDDARIFASPVVVDGKVLFGISVDGNDGHRGFFGAASLATGEPVWRHETNLDDSGAVVNDGCGNVWTSASIAPDLGLAYIATSDCHFANTAPGSEEVQALRIADGTVAWTYRPTRIDPGCDFAFGSSANVGLAKDGTAAFLGIGAKDGTYYSLDPATGALEWMRKVVFGGMSGGFIGTTAYDGRRVYGSTAIGDFGNFDNGVEVHCTDDPADVSHQYPGVHSLDARTGAIAYQAHDSRSFGPTTVAGGMTFHGAVLEPKLEIRDTTTGALVIDLALPTTCWSGVATVGNAIVFGTGSSYAAAPDGVQAYTPGGVPPVVPAG